MSDYIEREEVLQTIESCAGWSRPLESAYEEIQNLPAADVEPVVYCKDCYYLKFSDCYGECSRGLLGVVGPIDYCSLGVRKEAEHEAD